MIPKAQKLFRDTITRFWDKESPGFHHSVDRKGTVFILNTAGLKYINHFKGQLPNLRKREYIDIPEPRNYHNSIRSIFEQTIFP